MVGLRGLEVRSSIHLRVGLRRPNDVKWLKSPCQNDFGGKNPLSVGSDTRGFADWIVNRLIRLHPMTGHIKQGYLGGLPGRLYGEGIPRKNDSP